MSELFLTIFYDVGRLLEFFGTFNTDYTTGIKVQWERPDTHPEMYPDKHADTNKDKNEVENEPRHYGSDRKTGRWFGDRKL